MQEYTTTDAGVASAVHARAPEAMHTRSRSESNRVQYDRLGSGGERERLAHVSIGLAKRIDEKLSRTALPRRWGFILHLLKVATFGESNRHRDCGRTDPGTWCEVDLIAWSQQLDMKPATLRRVLRDIDLAQIIWYRPQPHSREQASIGWNQDLQAWQVPLSTRRWGGKRPNAGRKPRRSPIGESTQCSQESLSAPAAVTSTQAAVATHADSHHGAHADALPGSSLSREGSDCDADQNHDETQVKSSAQDSRINLIAPRAHKLRCCLDSAWRQIRRSKTVFRQGTRSRSSLTFMYGAPLDGANVDEGVVPVCGVDPLSPFPVAVRYQGDIQPVDQRPTDTVTWTIGPIRAAIHGDCSIAEDERPTDTDTVRPGGTASWDDGARRHQRRRQAAHQGESDCNGGRDARQDGSRQDGLHRHDAGGDPLEQKLVTYLSGLGDQRAVTGARAILAAMRRGGAPRECLDEALRLGDQQLHKRLLPDEDAYERGHERSPQVRCKAAYFTTIMRNLVRDARAVGWDLLALRADPDYAPASAPADTSAGGSSSADLRLSPTPAPGVEASPVAVADLTPDCQWQANETSTPVTVSAVPVETPATPGREADRASRSHRSASSTPPLEQATSEPVMTVEMRRLWRDASVYLSRQMTRAQYDTWIRGASLVRVAADAVVLCTKTSYAVEQLSSRFDGRVRDAITACDPTIQTVYIRTIADAVDLYHHICGSQPLPPSIHDRPPESTRDEVTAQAISANGRVQVDDVEPDTDSDVAGVANGGARTHVAAGGLHSTAAAVWPQTAASVVPPASRSDGARIVTRAAVRGPQTGPVPTAPVLTVAVSTVAVDADADADADAATKSTPTARGPAKDLSRSAAGEHQPQNGDRGLTTEWARVCGAVRASVPAHSPVHALLRDSTLIRTTEGDLLLLVPSLRARDLLTDRYREVVTAAVADATASQLREGARLIVRVAACGVPSAMPA